MPTWGLTDKGFYQPRYEEIRKERAARWRGLFGENRPTDDGTPDGHIISLAAGAEAEVWEAIADTYGSAYRDSAGGAPLREVAALLSLKPIEAAPSTVTLQLSGTAATDILAGAVVSHSTGTRWALSADVTLDGSGDGEGLFVCQETGPITASSSSTWTIETPVLGWDTAANAADADPGRNEETPGELRARMKQVTASGGVEADLRKLDGVTAVRVFENDTDAPDAVWGLTHWREVLVLGGDDQEVAEVIYRWNHHGIQDLGATVVSITDRAGNPYDQRLTRPTVEDIDVEITLVPGEGYPTSGDPVQTAKDAVAAWALANLGVGANVSPYQLGTPLSSAIPGLDSVAVRVALTGDSLQSTTLAIDDRSIADVDTSRITVIVS